ncbi:MAG: flagellar motor switch protein FliG [Treponema sp.]|jgi:flagellar motor switch protein FliG|nr:flagellar motor switch protein FliG [Treponema sp.]
MKQEQLLKVEGESKYRKIAKFLLLIGNKEASEILARLEPAQVEALTREIASIRGVNAPEAAAIIAEFAGVFSTTSLLKQGSYGGIETARRILHKTFGPEKGEIVLNKSVPASIANPFRFLEEYSSEQISQLLSAQSASLAAMVLAYLPPQKAAAAIKAMNETLKTEVVKRIAHRISVSPEILATVSEKLKEKAQQLERAVETEFDGTSILAAILKASESRFGAKILNDLAIDDPLTSWEIRGQLYMLDDVIRAEDRPIQEKLKTMTDRDIVILLKGKSERFITKILSNVSAGRRSQIRQEEEIIGAVSTYEVDMAATAFLDWFRINRENGTIILEGDKGIVS